MLQCRHPVNFINLRAGAYIGVRSIIRKLQTITSAKWTDQERQDHNLIEPRLVLDCGLWTVSYNNMNKHVVSVLS